MLPCDTCRDRLLDLQYGLLEPSEAASVDAHLADCPACRAARDEAARLRELLGKAAKTGFPDVRFVAPAESSTAVPATPAPAERRPSVRQVWVRWVVAASLLLTITGLCGPAARDVVGYYAHKPTVQRELAAVTEARDIRVQRQEQVALATSEADRRLAEAEDAYTSVADAWAVAEEQVATEVAARPFTVDVRGPTTAIPGAPNEYTLAVADKQGKPLATEVTAEVKDANGTVYYTTTFESVQAKPQSTLRLPADVWTDAPPTADLSLHITAVDSASGARSAVAEDVRLREPTYTTFVTTDKPMYQPGESLFFRSTTLDRTTFLPPKSELNLRFAVTAPSGQPVPGMDLIGLAKPANADGTPIFGPDGRPVRGVGTGAFPLPATLAGGEYTLSAYELPVNQSRPVPGAKPLAERKFVVNKYTPDRLLKKLEFDGKSYGPGDVVQAKFDVADQGQPLAGAKLTISAAADGKSLPLTAGPATTGPDGTAAIRFTLPDVEVLNDARLSVTVAIAGNVETIVRPVPLATRKLTVEFFPEGGDLIAGVPNTVYFRATTNTGKPADITGTLTDGVRDIAEVRTLTDADKPGVNQGLGSFEFTPKAGERYAVRLATPISVVPPVLASADAAASLFGTLAVTRGYELPVAKADGVALHVIDQVSEPGKPIRVRLTSAGAKRNVVVGAYIRGTPVAHTKATLDAGKPTEVVLDPGAATIGGVTRITVFEEPDEGDGRADLTPIAERLVYRNPGEVLKLAVTAKKPDGSAPKAFVPGQSITLDVAATTETGSPTAAVLWAAVVNKSVLTMADEKTERQMPTHFLLGGEVRNPAELEHADFLLTDHPKAEQTLDLLLGTQGWRRFAEQAPGRFRQRAPAEDADRLLVAMGADQPVPRGWRADVRRVFDDYWPQYEAAAHDLEIARNDDQTRTEVRDAEGALSRANSTYDARLSTFGQTAHDMEIYYDSILSRRNWLPATLGLLLAGIVVMIVTRAMRPATAGERRPLAFGAVGLTLVAGFLILTVGLTGFGNSDWRRMAAIAPKPQEYHYGSNISGEVATEAEPVVRFDDVDGEFRMEGVEVQNRVGVGGGAGGFNGGEMPMAGQARPVDDLGLRFGAAGQPKMAFAPRKPDAIPVPLAARPEAVPAMDMMRADPAAAPGLGAMAKMMAKPADFAGKANAPMPEQPLAFRDKMRGAKREAGKADAFGFGMELDDRELQNGRQMRRNVRQPIGELDRELPEGFAQALRKQVEKDGIADKKLPPLNDILRRVAESVPQSAPLVVREYAHARPTDADADGATRTDFTETLLWQPVVVTPTDGRVSLTFALADAVAPYRVLVAGHTLDGRIGAVSELIEVRKPFAVDPKLPPEISNTDTIDVPVLLTNATDNPLLAQLTVTPDGLKVDGNAERSVNLAANGGGRTIVRLTPTRSRGRTLGRREWRRRNGRN